MKTSDEIKLFRNVRALLGWAVAAVPVLGALAGATWYLAGHMHTSADAQSQLSRVESRQSDHEREHAQQLRSIDRKLSDLEPMIERRLAVLEISIERRLGRIEGSNARRRGRKESEE